jgi:hypothetical protein
MGLMARRLLTGPAPLPAVTAGPLLAREVVVDTDNRLRIGDGIATGGHVMARLIEVQAVDEKVELRATTVQLAAVSAAVAGKATQGAVDAVADDVAALQSAQVAGLLVYPTKSDIDGDLVPVANVAADVVADPTPANNGRYRKIGGTGTGSWTKVSSLANVSAGGTFDAALVADTAGGASNTWRKLADYGDQPALEYDLAVEGERQLLQSIQSNPHLRASASVVNDLLQVDMIQNGTFIAGAAVTKQAKFGETLTGAARIDTLVGSFDVCAIGPVFHATQPTPGAAFASTAAGAIHALYAQNGVVTFYGHDGTGSPSGASATVEGASAWRVTDTVRWEFSPTNEEGTQGICRWFGLDADGIDRLLATAEIVQPNENPWIGGAVRTAGNHCLVDHYPVRIKGRGVFVRKVINLHPDVGAVGGTGTEGNPFQTLAEAQEDVSLDTHRGSLFAKIKGGLWMGAALDIDHSRLNDVRIEAVKGTGPILNAGAVIPASSGEWTYISGEVWKTANRGALVGSRALVQKNTATAYGRTGRWTLPDKIYGMAALTLAAGSLVRGECSYHVSGTHAGSMLVRCHDGGDPNDSVWQMPVQRTPLRFRGRASGWNAPRIRLFGLTLEMGWEDCLRAIRASIELENCLIRNAAGGFGMELGDCDAEINGTWIEGHYGDAIHGGDTVFTDADRRIARWTVDGGGHVGGYYNPTAASVGAADGLSAHKYHQLDVRGWTSRGAGKHGVGGVGLMSLRDVDVDDAWDTAVSIAPYAGSTVTADIRRGRLSNCGRGILLDGTGGVCTAAVQVEDVRFEGQSISNLETFTSQVTAQPLTMTYRGCKRTGTAPETEIKQGPNTTLTQVTEVAI